MRRCTFCESQATLSVCVIVSTLGIKPRQQANTESVPVCRGCLERSEGWNGVSASPGIKERVNTAADALTKRSMEELQSVSEGIRGSDANTGARESAPALLSLPIGE